jgi:hypothetical protein
MAERSGKFAANQMKFSMENAQRALYDTQLGRMNSVKGQILDLVDNDLNRKERGEAPSKKTALLFPENDLCRFSATSAVHSFGAS